ncbi:unnamed protein product (macronuclear) [Paramecium tetraurelia]|uniref:Myb-like DNA-binding domain containing protein n=1 Tax=Paramecium tetraurelia TaxID=5888 RepID=A0CDX2_PARTE|nr:uncharacterized protein GSPATT00007201001 [Paramecium tetraurelia]CAK68989.1 unnamed protein product [Paramecium tetraurelia]|eukprot:XP_001436386.1 hypothetical protein (macronuclear) [Paramecium tetraurelia strain d4-2]
MSRKQTSSISPQIAKAIHKQSKDSDSSSSEKRYGKFWKPNEDSLLMELHIRHNGNWKLIAEGIPGRNLSQCQQRWKRINPNKWTDFEDQEVLRLVNEHGRNWKLIEGLMEGRSSKQIRERFLNNLDPEINREKFTLQEDQIILEQYRIYGPKWSEIAKMLNRRPENQVKNRFYSYIKRVHMLDERSDDEDNDRSMESEPEQPQKIVPNSTLNVSQPIYQPLETIQSLKEEHDNTKNDSLLINQTPSHRIQPSINLIQDSFDSKQFGGMEEQDNSPFYQHRKILDYSPINFQYYQHQPNFDMIQEDMKELKCQIESINIEHPN